MKTHPFYRHIRRLIAMWLTAWIMLSCAPEDFFFQEVDIPEEEYKPRLTLNAIAEISDSSDNVLIAFVTKSNPPTGPNKMIFINDAKVTLLEDDQPVETAQRIKNIKYQFNSRVHNLSGYVFDYQHFTHGKKYTLKVSALGYPTIESSQYLPYPAKITSWKYIPEGHVDLLEEETYDLIEIQLDELRRDQALIIQVTDTTEQFVYSLTTFSSEYFQPNSYTLLVRSKDISDISNGLVRIPLIPPDLSSTEAFIVHLHHINMNHYQFLREYSYNSESFFFIFANIPLSTNVKGGNGFFALEYIQKVTVRP